MNKRRIALVMGMYFFICLLAIIWPVISFVNFVYPLVLGLPFLMFWYVLWNLMVVIGLVITYRWEYSGEKAE